MVRSMLVVEYMVESTAFRLAYGLTTKAIVRWASTWSGPFCASSSTTNMAVCEPEFGVDDGVDDLAEREVVVADVSGGGAEAAGGAVGVVAGQAENLQAGHVAFGSRSV